MAYNKSSSGKHAVFHLSIALSLAAFAIPNEWLLTGQRWITCCSRSASYFLVISRLSSEGVRYTCRSLGC